MAGAAAAQGTKRRHDDASSSLVGLGDGFRFGRGVWDGRERRGQVGLIRRFRQRSGCHPWFGLGPRLRFGDWLGFGHRLGLGHRLGFGHRPRFSDQLRFCLGDRFGLPHQLRFSDQLRFCLGDRLGLGKRLRQPIGQGRRLRRHELRGGHLVARLVHGEGRAPWIGVHRPGLHARGLGNDLG